MTNKKISRSFPVKGTIIIYLLKFLALLPLSISRRICGYVAWISYHRRSRSRHVTEVNLQLCFPNMSLKERNCLAQESLKESALLMAETAKIWFYPAEKMLPMIMSIEGEVMLREHIADPDKGTLIISPHIGNWELLYSFLASNFNSSGLYRPPKIAELEPIIRSGRRRGGGEMIRTSQMDVRKMLRVLQKAGSLFLLPDQQPQQGSGVFAPFYGQKAYTMTLLQGLAKRTGAEVIIASCIRLKKGFKVTFSKVNIDTELSNEVFAEQLNRTLERVINKSPAQYEWAYKRFKACSDSDPDLYN